MIQISLYRDGSGRICGFRCAGHAGYAENGSDIVCAAVSALAMTTVNSVEQLTSDRFSYKESEAEGQMEFRIVSGFSEVSEILMKSLALGFSGIAESYGGYVRVTETSVK